MNETSAEGAEASVDERLPQLTLEDLPPPAQLLAQAIIESSSGGLLGPYNVMLRSPVMAQRLKALMDYARHECSLDRRLVEFAILIQARLWTSDVEWHSHYPQALKAGLAQQIADDLKANRRPSGMRVDEEAVYDVCMGMAHQHGISDGLFLRAREALGEPQLVDLMAVAGTYHTVAMMLSLNRGGWPPHATVSRPFADRRSA